MRSVAAGVAGKMILEADVGLGVCAVEDFHN